MCCPDHVNLISVELRMFLPSALRAELEVRRDDDECNSLRSTKQSLWAPLSSVILSIG